MSTCCTIMQISKASTTTYCWIFHLSVFQPPIQVIAATSVARGPDAPLPSRYHHLLRGKSQSAPRPSEKYNLSHVPQVFSLTDMTETPPRDREASRKYPDQVPKTIPKGSSPRRGSALSFSWMSELLTLFLKLSLSRWLLPKDRDP